MPRLLACSVAYVLLVISVGLQAPATSVGLRITPSPRSTAFRLPRFEMNGAFDFSFTLRPTNWWPAWANWILVVLAAIALLFAMRRWVERRPHAVHVAGTGADHAAPTEAEARILKSGLAAAIEHLDAEGISSDAVVQAWQALQDAAASAGLHRRPAETASEFTARILYRSRRSADSIAVLLALYHRVRFGEYLPTASDISAARHALSLLVELWRADFPDRKTRAAVRA